MASFSFESDIAVTPGGTLDVKTSDATSVIPEFAFENIPNLSGDTIKHITTTRNPENVAKADRLSKQYDIPLSEVVDDPDVIVAEENRLKIQGLSTTHLGTSRYLDDETNLSISHDDIDALTSIEEIANSFQRGFLTRELGVAGSTARATQHTESFRRISEIEDKLTELGIGPESGFISWLTSASEVLGQWAGTLSDQRAAIRVGAGGALGAAAGFAGGPLAPITVPAGTAVGLASGLVSHFTWDAFETEGGLAYIDMRREGVDDDVASALSVGVGIVNAGLETATTAVGAKIIGEGAKIALRKTISEIMKSETVKKAAIAAVGGYGALVATETSTEILQEIVQIAAEEWGKALTGDIEAADPDEIKARIEEIAIRSFKAMTILAAPGAGYNMNFRIREARKAAQYKDLLLELHGAISESKTLKRSPEKSFEHFSTVLDAALGRDTGFGDIMFITDDQRSIFIPADKLMEWLSEQENSEQLAVNIGASVDLQRAVALGIDIEISGENFGRYILSSPNFEMISSHIRFTPEGMTFAEAEEYVNSGLRDDIERSRDLTLDTDEPEVLIAEDELGLKGLFETAKDAGMTDSEYTRYVEKLEIARRKANLAILDRKLARKDRELSVEWKQEEQAVRAVVIEHLNQSVQAYGAINGIGHTRLERKQVKELLEQMGMNLDLLPKQSRNRNLYSSENEARTIDPQTYAELHGYANAFDMLAALVNAKPFKENVDQTTNRVMQERHGGIIQQRNEISEARKFLHNNDQASVLEAELAALRKAQKAKRLSSKLIKRAALDEISNMPIKSINPRIFLNASKRLGQKAGVALRKGDRNLAMLLKFQQLLHFRMAQESYRIVNKIERQRKFMARFMRNSKANQRLPIEKLEAIHELLENVGLLPKISKEKRNKLEKEYSNERNPSRIPAALRDARRAKHYRDMNFGEFSELHDTVKEIHHNGITATKLKSGREERELDVIVAIIKDAVDVNLDKNRDTEMGFNISTWDKTVSRSSSLATLLYNMDTLVRELDGFEDFGPVYENIKGRYDRAVADGYREDQIGLLNRQHEAAVAIIALYDKYTENEKRAFNNKIRINGVNKTLSRNIMVSVLLNSGNIDNLKALIESGTFTEEEIKAIHDHASQKDWEFAQSVWDYFETFWPEVVEAEQRRRNYTPERVQAEPINTKFGTYKGGYYPIKYDTEHAAQIDPDNTEALLNHVKYGDFASSMTKRNHVESRKNPGQHRVLLDVFTINSHLDQVIYDLEMGDALRDIYKILYQKDLRPHFAKRGFVHKWDAMDLWLRDQITSEIGIGHPVEKALRHLRTGLTLSKLAWNVPVALLQPLGIIQAGVQIGHKNVLWGLRTLLDSNWVGEDNIFDILSEESTIMRTRQVTYDKDQADALRVVHSGILEKITTDKQFDIGGVKFTSAELIIESFFYMIKKMQRLADAIVYLGARKEGIEKFNGDIEKARRHAERMVLRTQASSIFGERTPFERGSINKNTRQTEIVRAFSLFMSFFMAKTNVALERMQKVDKLDAMSWLKLGSDLILLYMVDAVLVGLIKGEWPEEDDDESFISYSAGEVINTLLAGIPIMRDVNSAIQGFTPGGTLGILSEDLARIHKQLGQGEADLGAFKALNNVGGMLLKYPSSFINKEAEVIARMNNGEDVTFWDFLLGPTYKDK